MLAPIDCDVALYTADKSVPSPLLRLRLVSHEWYPPHTDAVPLRTFTASPLGLTLIVPAFQRHHGSISLRAGLYTGSTLRVQPAPCHACRVLGEREQCMQEEVA